jgi:hypothetical protein
MLNLFLNSLITSGCKVVGIGLSMDHDIESVRLRLKQVFAQLQKLEANDMPFDAELLTELRFLIRYFRNHGFTIHVVRERSSLRVRIEGGTGAGGKSSSTASA